MRRLSRFALAASLCMLAAGCSADANQTKAPDSMKIHDDSSIMRVSEGGYERYRYTNVSEAFSIDFPKGWTVIDNTGQKIDGVPMLTSTVGLLPGKPEEGGERLTVAFYHVGTDVWSFARTQAREQGYDDPARTGEKAECEEPQGFSMKGIDGSGMTCSNGYLYRFFAGKQAIIGVIYRAGSENADTYANMIGSVWVGS